MRTIERNMLAAIANKRDWSCDNTRVVVHSVPCGCELCAAEGGRAYVWADVYLHGNHIATYHYANGRALPNRETARRWPTNTTRSRLNALGIHCNVRKGTIEFADAAQRRGGENLTPMFKPNQAV